MFTKSHWRNDVAEKGWIMIFEYIQEDIGGKFEEIKRLKNKIEKLDSEIAEFKKRMMRK